MMPRGWLIVCGVFVSSAPAGLIRAADPVPSFPASVPEPMPTRSWPDGAIVEPPPLYIPPGVKGFQATMMMREYYLTYYYPQKLAEQEAKRAAQPARPPHAWFRLVRPSSTTALAPDPNVGR